MQEQQHGPGRLRGAGTHLHGAAARCCNDAVRPHARALDCRVAAAAVHDHDLDAKRAQVIEVIESAGDTFAFVEHRHDDGKAGHSRERDHLAASDSAPPQLEPCPAVQP